MNARLIGLLAVFALVLSLAPVGFAADPDFLTCDAEPQVIHATWDQSMPSTTEVTVQVNGLYADGVEEPLRMCGIEIKCESQNPDILNNGIGGSTLVGTADEFGRVTFEFVSTDNDEPNVGVVDIICRSLQETSCTTQVEVKSHIPDLVELSMCPEGNPQDNGVADIIADGESMVRIAAQLKNDKYDNDTKLVPTKRENITVKFLSLNTNIVRECGTDVGGDGLHFIQTLTDSQGVAYANFCSSGSGSENEGTAQIRVQVDGGFDITNEIINVTTTRNFGTTTINGELNIVTIPTQILADGTSTVTACTQLRKTTGDIIKDPPEKVVSLVSHNTSHLLPVNSSDSNNPAYVEVGPDSSFPQGGIFTTLFKSAGIHNPNSAGTALIEGSAEFFAHDFAEVQLVDAQYWPSQVIVSESPPKILCDGVSDTRITAQLLDDNGYPVFMEGRLIRFKSGDTSLLVDADDGDAIASDFTDKFGKAHAWFRAKECKLDNTDGGTVYVTVSSISDQITENAEVEVVLPKGFKPTGVNAYTDHTLEHLDGTHAPISEPNAVTIASHAAPSLISADGQKPVFVTAQACEWTREDPNLREGADHTDLSLDRDGDGENDEFCNPVKRPGVRIEFKVEDDRIVMNKRNSTGQNDSEDLVDVVYLETDEEGLATAVFRSSGTTPTTNEGCTNIRITAQNGMLLDGPSYARVCSVQHEATSPNAAWVWAQPAFITADGTSQTVLRTALYWCNEAFLNASELFGPFRQENDDEIIPGEPALSPDQLTGLTTRGANDDNPNTWCKPVQLAGAEVKFESLSPQILDDGVSGFKVITTTDQYGQAIADFFSTGFEDQNIGKSEITVFVDHIGEDVVQLNELFVHTEEKTWPWCERTLSPGGQAADTSGDGFISDSELLNFLIKWFNGSSPFTLPKNLFGTDGQLLLEAISDWADQ